LILAKDAKYGSKNQHQAKAISGNDSLLQLHSTGTYS